MTVDEYLSLPWDIKVEYSTEDGVFVARALNIPHTHLADHGDTEEEARGELRLMMGEWITWLLEEGEPIPVPALATDCPSVRPDPADDSLKTVTVTPGP